jgi:hypothetical protein
VLDSLVRPIQVIDVGQFCSLDDSPVPQPVMALSLLGSMSVNLHSL